MARPLRIELPGAYYHILNRGLARQGVFSDRIDRLRFIQLLGDCHEMWGIRILAYCLLENHYHLLLQTPEANLSRVMRHLDGVYTQQYNRRHGRDGPLFRGRYTAILVEEESYLLAVARYIHQNPVGAGLARSPEAFEWSSCRLYLSHGKEPRWLETGQVLGRFPRHNRLAAFLTFMRSAVEEPVRAFYESGRRGPVLGSSEFIERLRRRVRESMGSSLLLTHLWSSVTKSSPPTRESTRQCSMSLPSLPPEPLRQVGVLRRTTSEPFI